MSCYHLKRNEKENEIKNKKNQVNDGKVKAKIKAEVASCWWNISFSPQYCLAVLLQYLFKEKKYSYLMVHIFLVRKIFIRKWASKTPKS